MHVNLNHYLFYDTSTYCCGLRKESYAGKITLRWFKMCSKWLNLATDLATNLANLATLATFLTTKPYLGSPKSLGCSFNRKRDFQKFPEVWWMFWRRRLATFLEESDSLHAKPINRRRAYRSELLVQCETLVVCWAFAFLLEFSWPHLYCDIVLFKWISLVIVILSSDSELSCAVNSLCTIKGDHLFTLIGPEWLFCVFPTQVKVWRRNNIVCEDYYK